MAAKDLYEKDYYQILGVAGNADSAAIKKQYRKLARELHPDKTKGDKKLEDRFKAVSVALNCAAFNYEIATLKYKSGPEVINARDIYLKHVKEYENTKEELMKYQDYLSSKASLKSKK